MTIVHVSQLSRLSWLSELILTFVSVGAIILVCAVIIGVFTVLLTNAYIEGA